MFFVILLTLQVALFIRLKFRLNLPAKVTLLLYLFVALLRFVEVFTDRYGSIGSVLNLLTQALIFTAMYYFVFEMQTVLLTVEQIDPIHCSKVLAKQRKIKICVLTLSLLYAIIATVIAYLMKI